jgi:cation transporter-like permease
MGIGISVFLLALGGVLAFAVTDAISGVDLTVVGYVLMAAGAIGLAVALIFANQRSHTSHVSVQERRHIDE